MQTGKLDIVKDNIDNIYAYVDHLACPICTPMTYKDENGDKQEDARLTGETGTLCDHLSRIPTDGVMLGNVLYINCLDQAAVLADAMGDTEKAQSYREAAATAREAGMNSSLTRIPEKQRTPRVRSRIPRLPMQHLFVSM